MTSLSLTSLPTEILIAIAGHLENQPLLYWMITSRYFYDVFVGLIYKRDLDAEDKRLSLRAGIQGNLAALHRVALCPSVPADLYQQAIYGHHAQMTVAYLLSKGVVDECTADKAAFWPMLKTILGAALRPPRWCPAPIISSFFEHGYRLNEASSTEETSAVWDMIFQLVQVHGPRPRRSGVSGSNTDDLRYDHCQHSTEACNVFMARLLLQKGKASSSASTGDKSLLARAMQDKRRPVELMRCLADAGADLNAPVLSASSRTCTPILAALEDALRLKSLANNPRGRSWDCHPTQVEYPEADKIVQFLLSKGVDGTDEADSKTGKENDNLTLRLLDFWDPEWRRLKRRPFKSSGRRNRGHKKQRLE